VFPCVGVAGAHFSLEGNFINLYLQMLIFPFVLSFLFLFLLCRKFRSSGCSPLCCFTLRFFPVCFTEFAIHRIWANEYCNIYRHLCTILYNGENIICQIRICIHSCGNTQPSDVNLPTKLLLGLGNSRRKFYS